MKRKLILPAAALTVLLLCSGCGSKPETGGADTGLPAETAPAAADTTDAPEEATAAPAEATVTPEGATAAREETTEPTEEPKSETSQEQPFLAQITEDDPSTAYVLVRMQQSAGLLPLPAEGEYTRTIRQVMADGSEAVNVLHITADGFRMEDANCEGHDCVNEGEVTLENRETRVLWNMVICLPHQLSAELITREEAEGMFRQR